MSIDHLGTFVRSNWPFLAAVAALSAGLYLAVSEGDEQSRRALQYAYSVRMTCENDPESPLWSGGCDRIAADIARTDKPSFLDLYKAFRSVYQSGAPADAGQRAPAVPDKEFAAGETLAGTRYLISRREFDGVVNAEQARAVMDAIDARDRALLTIERDGRLSERAFAAATLANLTSIPAILAAIAVLLLLWLGRRRA
jgi:hypothetical protein